MKFRFRTIRRVVGIGSLMLFAIAFVGCDTTNYRGFDYQGADRVMVPFAHIGVVAMLVASACLVPDVLRAQKESNRRSKGQCVGCGYSLKGNMSGVCPECGERIHAIGETA